MLPLDPVPRRTSTSSTGGTRAGGRNGGSSSGGSAGGAADGGGGGGRKMGRKMDASHLLNFSLPARQEAPPAPRRSKRTGGGEGARWTLYNKEKFVNASFSFMLNPKGDYTAYFADSDIFFRWPDILQILVPGAGGVSGGGSSSSSSGQAAQLPTCPICLSDPVAPRMTKCGHVYCYSCVLQYLALADSKTARCPICNDMIHSKDLKSVRALPSITLPPAASAPNSLASPSTSPTAATHMPVASTSKLPQQPLRLMQRPHNTTLALPQSATWPSAAIPPHEAPFHFLPDVTSFSRFMLASPEYIFGALDQDQSDLEGEKIMQRQAGESDLGLAFIEGARTRILEAKERLAAEIGGPDGLVARKVLEVRQIALKAEGRAQLKAAREQDRLDRLALSQARSPPPPPPPSSPLPPATALAPEFVPQQSSLPRLPDPLFPDAPVLGGPPAQPQALLHHQGHSASAPSLPTLAQPPAPPPPLSTSPSPSFLSTSPPKPVLPVKPRLPSSSVAGLSDDPAFFFYQSADGRHIYLHPLDIRVLLAEFKTYAAFPERLVVGVEGTEEGTMNEDLRKRCKYLAHLPTGCAILFVQVDLTAHVSAATLAAFETPLRQRRQRRKEKGKKEERERRRAEDREREEEETQRRNLTSDNFPSSWGHTPSLGGGDDFEDALARSLWDADPDGAEHDGDGDPTRRSSTAPPQVTAATSIWSSRLFAAPPSRSAEDDAEVAALWRQFEAQQQLDSGGGRGGARVVEGASSTGSGGAAGSAAGKKKKGRGQKLVLTGGGRGAG